MERIVKAHEVILKAMAGSLKWSRERYQESGCGWLHGRRKVAPRSQARPEDAE
jgi:hypothetical protein